MKKILMIAAVTGLAMISCKKDRTCTCTNTVISRTSTQPGYNYTPQEPTTSTDKYSKIKKSNVLAQQCVTDEHTYTYIDNVYNNTTKTYDKFTVTSVSKNDCTLK